MANREFTDRTVALQDLTVIQVFSEVRSFNNYDHELKRSVGVASNRWKGFVERERSDARHCDKVIVRDDGGM